MTYRLRIFSEDDTLLFTTDHELPQDAGYAFAGHETEEEEPITLEREVTRVEADGENERDLTEAEESAVFDGVFAGLNQRMQREIARPFPDW